jgi:hypothetical protein
MSIVIQLKRTLTERILEDLRRPHGHAAERVGFLFGRLTSGDTDMVVMTRYVPVPDEQYVVDDTVGARINGDAIRAAMQAVLDTGDGVFHTHLHEWPGRPAFSRTDSTELPRLIPAFRAVGPAQATGLFLLSPDSAIAEVWLPGAMGHQRASRILIVD